MGVFVYVSVEDRDNQGENFFMGCDNDGQIIIEVIINW